MQDDPVWLRGPRNLSRATFILRETKPEPKVCIMHRKQTIRPILITLMILFVTALSAQDMDHVYLKNGSVIRGNIQEIEPADHVKIQDL